MNTHRTVTIISTALFGAAALLGTGIAHAESPSPGSQAAPPTTPPFFCEENFHNQGNGMCTWVDTQPVPFDGGLYVREMCPSAYPFPAQGAFSDNPIWSDKSTFPHYFLMKAVSATRNAKDLMGESLSYAGTSSSDPGYASLYANNRGGDSYHASFVCSNVAAQRS